MRIPLFLMLFIAVFILPGCEAIGAIFEAGVWVGVIVVVLLLAIIGFIASKFR